MQRWHLVLAAGLLLTGCGEEHPAFHLGFDVSDAHVRQTERDASDFADVSMKIIVTPDSEHTESWLSLPRDDRLPDGRLVGFGPYDGGRFRYDARNVKFEGPAAMTGAPVHIVDEAVETSIAAQVTNRELEILCGDEIVLVADVAVTEREPAEPVELNNETPIVELRAQTTVECR